MLPLTSTFPLIGKLASQVYQATDLGLMDQNIPYRAKSKQIAAMVPAA
jgi:hypothetical protein